MSPLDALIQRIANLFLGPAARAAMIATDREFMIGAAALKSYAVDPK